MRTDLAHRAVDLTRTLRALMPDEPEIRGLLALLLVTEARRETRTDAGGRMLLLADQDRSRWDRAAIGEGHELIVSALRSARPGRFALQAAIAGMHATAPSFAETDWPQILMLYDALLVAWPSPVVALNRAVAISMVHGIEAALAEIAVLEGDQRLATYHYLYSNKGELLRRIGRRTDAVSAFRTALTLVENDTEREFLVRRIEELA
jgi:RNA polymerase sigma-70 factor (ECF subfamily)